MFNKTARQFLFSEATLYFSRGPHVKVVPKSLSKMTSFDQFRRKFLEDPMRKARKVPSVPL